GDPSAQDGAQHNYQIPSLRLPVKPKEARSLARAECRAKRTEVGRHTEGFAKPNKGKHNHSYYKA
ncbi:hypothetical protein VF12_40095, partial [Nostoc linckia z15]